MRTLFFYFIILLVSSQLYAQIDHTKAGETLLLTATVKNELGEPVSIEVRFADLTNKPVIARSNEEGTLQAVLKQGMLYYPIFKNYIEVGGLHTFETAKTGKYTEDAKMFLVRKIQENSELHKLTMFKPSDSNLTDEGIAFLQFFKEFYSLNKNLQFKMVISASEMNFKDIKQTRTEIINNKKKQVKFTVSAREQMQHFLEARSNALVSKLKELNIPAKIFNYEYNTKITPKKQVKGKKQVEQSIEPNATIIIEKLLKL